MQFGIIVTSHMTGSVFKAHAPFSGDQIWRVTAYSRTVLVYILEAHVRHLSISIFSTLLHLRGEFGTFSPPQVSNDYSYKLIYSIRLYIRHEKLEFLQTTQGPRIYSDEEEYIIL